jgi:SAM-dependent methyltransferase
VQALARQGDSAITFSSFLGQNPAPSSLRDALLFERTSMYRAGTYTISPGDTRFATPANEGETRYLATHLKRYEVTLDLLAAIGHRKGNISVIADLSTSPLYHPGLLAQFPTTQFIFTGHGNNADQPSTSADRIQWICGQNLETHPLPLPDESVDLVMLLEVLEHFEIDPLHALAEINRVLKPGGILFLYHPQPGILAGDTIFATGTKTGPVTNRHPLEFYGE